MTDKNSEVLHKAEVFIRDCQFYDQPRLEAEVFPEGVEVRKDIPYVDDGSPEHLLDIYDTTGNRKTVECYILIHGGAFVYGYKELDKNFGMRLAKTSGIPVVNVNYRLMPGVSLTGVIEDLESAVDFVRREYGFDTYHFTGDSAGGYLAMLMAVRNDRAVSASLICGCYTVDREDFPGAFFAGAGEEIPEEYYDLKLLAGRVEQMDVAIITGDDDFLREDNRALAALIPHAEFYDAVSAGGRVMTHVFPIGHPDWPEGQKAIDIISSFARKSC